MPQTKFPHLRLYLALTAPAKAKPDFVADTFSMYNPDVEDGSRTTAFQSIDEFILSDGEPMVVLESTMTGMYYLVKARDIVHCAPIVSSDE
jgi:hypothetical protein